MITLPELLFSDYLSIKDNCNLKHLEQGLYLLYNEDKALLYIGKSVNILNRLKTHISTSSFKNDIRYFRTSIINDSTDLDIYETYYINKLKPLHNKGKYYTKESTINKKSIYNLINLIIFDLKKNKSMGIN